MPYIPKEHERYDVLPWKRKNGGEVFDYPSKLLFQIEEIIGHDLTPYGYESYEEYYKEVDTCAEPFKDDPVVTKLFVNYKAEVMRMNRKEEWSICKYKGDRIGEIMGLETGHTSVHAGRSPALLAVGRAVPAQTMMNAFIQPTVLYYFQIKDLYASSGYILVMGTGTLQSTS